MEAPKKSGWSSCGGQNGSNGVRAYRAVFVAPLCICFLTLGGPRVGWAQADTEPPDATGAGGAEAPSSADPPAPARLTGGKQSGAAQADVESPRPADDTEAVPRQDSGSAKGALPRPVGADDSSDPRPTATRETADARSGDRSGRSDDKAKSEDGGSDRQKNDQKKKKHKPYQPAGPTAVVGAMGFEYGLTEDSVGGFRLGFSYGYRLTDWMWFDAQVNFSFGSDCSGAVPSGGTEKEYKCGSVHGFGIEAVAGVQWKFYGIKAFKAPVVPFVRAGLGAVAIVSNGPNDGVAIVARGAGGVRYHFFPWFAIGGELGASIGPAFRNHLDTGFFASLDVMAGAEFHF